jgi:hypothetical protein
MVSGNIIKEIGLTFLGAFLMALWWTFLIMRGGLKEPAEVISIMQNHLQQYAGYFIFFDILIFGLLIRWIQLARKPKAPINVWE